MATPYQRYNEVKITACDASDPVQTPFILSVFYGPDATQAPKTLRKVFDSDTPMSVEQAASLAKMLLLAYHLPDEMAAENQ